jgi:hypothetical protein
MECWVLETDIILFYPHHKCKMAQSDKPIVPILQYSNIPMTFVAIIADYLLPDSNDKTFQNLHTIAVKSDPSPSALVP